MIICSNLFKFTLYENDNNDSDNDDDDDDDVIITF